VERAGICVHGHVGWQAGQVRQAVCDQDDVALASVSECDLDTIESGGRAGTGYQLLDRGVAQAAEKEH
jgi:hypothetical protein